MTILYTRQVHNLDIKIKFAILIMKTHFGWAHAPVQVSFFILSTNILFASFQFTIFSTIILLLITL